MTGIIIGLVIDFLVILAEFGTFILGVVYATAFSNTGKVNDCYQAALLFLMTIAIGSMRRKK